MESISSSPHIHLLHRNPISVRFLSLNPSIISLPCSFSHLHQQQRVCALKTRRNGGGAGGGSSSQQDDGGAAALRAAELLKRSVVEAESAADFSKEEEEEEEEEYEDEDGGERSGEEEWVDWEDQILQDTVPLVGFVRMILHSDKYKSGERLSPEHENVILERLLAYHPECERKIGCGVDHITVGHHPDFGTTRCLFIVRKDGKVEDFSFWKCIKGLIKKKYPLYADSFILRHFRSKRRDD